MQIGLSGHSLTIFRSSQSSKTTTGKSPDLTSMSTASARGTSTKPSYHKLPEPVSHTAYTNPSRPSEDWPFSSLPPWTWDQVPFHSGKKALTEDECIFRPSNEKQSRDAGTPRLKARNSSVVYDQWSPSIDFIHSLIHPSSQSRGAGRNPRQRVCIALRGISGSNLPRHDGRAWGFISSRPQMNYSLESLASASATSAAASDPVS